MPRTISRTMRSRHRVRRGPSLTPMHWLPLATRETRRSQAARRHQPRVSPTLSKIWRATRFLRRDLNLNPLIFKYNRRDLNLTPAEFNLSAFPNFTGSQPRRGLSRTRRSSSSKTG